VIIQHWVVVEPLAAFAVACKMGGDVIRCGGVGDGDGG
jgi:hypothetical protein